MTFLAPIAGIIAASVAVPALVLLYFLKLRRRPVRVSSTLLWEKSVHDLQVNVPIQWIKFSALLLLQLLALACLLVALARPAIDIGTPASTRVVVLIDRSASMSARDGGLDPSSGLARTRLDQAKERAAEFVTSTLRAGGGQVLVAQFAARAQVAANFSGQVSDATDAIAAITPSDQPGDLAAAVKLIEPLSAQNGDESETLRPLTVMVLSDGGAMADGESKLIVATGLDIRFVRCGPEETPVGAAPMGTTGGPWNGNLGIVAASATRDAEDPATVRVFARLANSSVVPTSTLVRLALDGRDVASAAAQVPGRGAGGTGGETGVTLTISNTVGGVLTLSLPGGDLLGADDSASVVLPPLKRPRVLLVRPDGSSRPGIDDLLPALLKELDVQSLAVISEGDLEDRLAVGGGGGGGVDLLILDRVTPRKMPGVASISIGGELPLAAAVPAEPGRAGTPAVSLKILTGSEQDGSARAIVWKRNHPILRYVGLDTLVATPSVGFKVPTGPINVGDDASGGNGVVSIETLAEGPLGALVALVQAPNASGVPTRHLALAFDLAQTNWPTEVSFLVFLTNAVDDLTARSQRDSARSFTTGGAVTVRAAAGAQVVTASGPVVVSGAVQREEAGGTGGGGGGSVSLGIFERVGLYRCSGVIPEDEAVAVNLLSAEESAISCRDALNIAGTQTKAMGDVASGPREVYQQFILAALILLTIEWFLYAYWMRG